MSEQFDYRTFNFKTHHHFPLKFEYIYIYIYTKHLSASVWRKKKAQNKTLSFLHFDSLQMMSGNAFTIPSSLGGFVHQEQNPNPNPKPNQAASKKKRNLPGTPGN